VGHWDVEEDCWRVVEGGVDWTACLQLPKTDHHRDQSCNNYEEKSVSCYHSKKEQLPCLPSTEQNTVVLITFFLFLFLFLFSLFHIFLISIIKIFSLFHFLYYINNFLLLFK
jgi:hypothetical protein